MEKRKPETHRPSRPSVRHFVTIALRDHSELLTYEVAEDESKDVSEAIDLFSREKSEFLEFTSAGGDVIGARRRSVQYVYFTAEPFAVTQPLPEPAHHITLYLAGRMRPVEIDLEFEDHDSVRNAQIMIEEFEWEDPPEFLKFWDQDAEVVAVRPADVIAFVASRTLYSKEALQATDDPKPQEVAST